MTVSRPAGAAVAVAPGVDLRRAPLADVMTSYFRGENRDFWAHDAAWLPAARVPGPPGDEA